MDDREFSWGVEAAIDPQAVLSAGYHARSAVRLPAGIRRRLVQGASGGATPMSFVVEPYSLFAVFDAMLDNARPRTLDRQLWVLGNLTVGYGAPLSTQSSPEFSLLFLPGEMSKALSVAPADALVRVQGWYQGLLAPQASLVLCFPFAQHFLCDAPGMHSSYQGLRSLAAVEHAKDYGILQAELAARANHPR